MLAGAEELDVDSGVAMCDDTQLAAHEVVHASFDWLCGIDLPCMADRWSGHPCGIFAILRRARLRQVEGPPVSDYLE